MTQEHDYEAAFDRFKRYLRIYDYDPDLRELFGDDAETIQSALKLAARIERGEVSDGMKIAAGDSLVKSTIFKAMAKRLLWEVER